MFGKLEVLGRLEHLFFFFFKFLLGAGPIYLLQFITSTYSGSGLQNCAQVPMLTLAIDPVHSHLDSP